MDPSSVMPEGASSKPTDEEGSPTEARDEETSGSKKASVRKRTKTGCLTCRKRRIKCDEGRPTCGNCIKSKRQCEGYNQRVIFKDPLGAFAGAPMAVAYPQPSPQVLVREQLSAAAQRSSSQSLQIIAPKPPSVGYHPPPGQHYGHVYPPGPVGPAGLPPLNYNPTAYAQPPAPAEYTFMPQDVSEVYVQSQWQQNAQAGPHRIPSGRGNEVIQNLSPISPHDQSLPTSGRGSIQTEAEPQADEEFEYLSDEDASMADSEDESQVSQPLRQLALRRVDALASQGMDSPYNPYDLRPRMFTSFAPDNILANYTPSPTNSPLNDPKQAAVFCHFVWVTGPSISLYERHPFDPSKLFDGSNTATKESRDHIWTYTFPILAFSHPALLQAILALSSLQIARLQQVPPTASLKHYHLALRRIAKNVGNPTKRTQPSNLAATLLLAYYEIWNSELEKWHKHLLGATWIMRDIPFREMSRSMMEIKRQRRQRMQDLGQYPLSNFEGDPILNGPDAFHSEWDIIDPSLMSSILGRALTEEELETYGVAASANSRPLKRMTQRDMDQFEQLSDLFWWYCKMDVYMSILGGTRLFMDFKHWTQCPPRAPMGRLDAIYGTYDHLMLLLGRLANFNSRDLSRKRKAAKKEGRSPPNMFPGMMPASATRVGVPMGFSPPKGPSSPQSDGTEEVDLEEATNQALQEWESIHQAFTEFKSHFGPAFEPLGDEYVMPIMTPFGPARHYSTYSIAGIWLNYYMGMIMLFRTHPNMPPAAMMAVGMQARHTAGCAVEIARIAGAIGDNAAELKAVSTLVGSALIESAFCLFVAGVQFQEQAQRDWLIRRLYHIRRLTGWKAATQISDGVQSAWNKAASLGKGKPYHHPPDIPEGGMASIWGNPRAVDLRMQELKADDNNLVVLAKSEKVTYAVGLLQFEQDLENLNLEEDEKQR